MTAKFVLYHKDDYDDDDYDVDDLNVSVEGRVNWTFHEAMNSILWLQTI